MAVRYGCGRGSFSRRPCCVWVPLTENLRVLFFPQSSSAPTQTGNDGGVGRQVGAANTCAVAPLGHLCPYQHPCPGDRLDRAVGLSKGKGANQLSVFYELINRCKKIGGMNFFFLLEKQC